MTEYELPDPYAYIYEFDSVFGLHKSFSSREYNGSKPSCTVLVYTADQLREEVAKAEQRGREAMRDECAAFAVRNAGVVAVSRWGRMIKELK